MLGLGRKTYKKKKKRFKSSLFIDIDAWIDSSLYQFKTSISLLWLNITFLSRRLHLTGWKRFFVEIVDESLTLGLIGFTLFTIIGIPVFDLTKNDWLAPRDFAVNFLDRQGNPIGSRGTVRGETVPIEDMPDYLIKAVLATEDRRFFDHWGIDFYGLSRALQQNIRANGVVQGGSTLTQQLAKNLFLNNERTISRKIKEAYLALWLEANLTKKQILQLYLDRAYMGGGAFGISTASKFYFGKDIRQVSLAEAAMLAGLFKAPGKYAPHINLPAARARANVVLSNLVDNNMMSEGQVIKARREPANVITALHDDQPNYFLDWAFDEVKKLENQLPSRNLTVRTTLDFGIQKAAEESIAYHLRAYGAQYRVSQAAAVIIDNDGSVRAIVGGKDYLESQFNRATQSGRQPGSSFKPYVYAVAMEQGLTPKTIISDAPINWGGWSPRNNSGRYRGNVDLATALAFSINTVPVRLTYQNLHKDTQPIRDLIKNMGINADIFSHKTMVLGTSNMTPLDQATGFNVFANGGMAGNRHGFTQIFTAQGRLIWDFLRDGEKPHRALSEQSAAYMNQMLVGVTTRGSGKRAQLPMNAVAGKTGTSQEHRDAWFVGYTGNYTGAVWMGNDDFSPMNRAFGGVVPAMMWQRMMLYAHDNTVPKPLFGVENSVFTKKQKSIIEQKNYHLESEIPATLSRSSTLMMKKILNAFENAPSLTDPTPSHIVSTTTPIMH
ncbi:transglycosylase domain-containing protein [Bartonella tamiae]|uniref:1A family penicillin-binding protein n=1 Tax=Bartonella tamiae Th239 TaxID=1094558 RepID=J1JZM0_9HYPH|nr:penicillin-binding protein 1A [Bartonella tamiae]EJF90577.1 1A family penicillin-binding protein [Bartonella tamiae Th239]EJF94045.1 1A family penicillin-binding protein [Bartonella tamiae Th307]